MFVAVELSPEARRQVEEIQSSLRAAAPDYSWVRPENFHLTLKFLGSTASESVPSVERALQLAASQRAPFEVKLRGVGAFPTASRARVVWVGLAPEAPLVELAGRVEGELAKVGFAREARPYTAHVTVGRCPKPRRHEALQKKLGELAGAGGACTVVAETVLMQSQLRPGGAIYTPVGRYPLGGKS